LGQCPVCQEFNIFSNRKNENDRSPGPVKWFILCLTILTGPVVSQSAIYDLSRLKTYNRYRLIMIAFLLYVII
jgi:hypothetical protein